ncbi:molybdopterin-dependent oxidoreductase [Vibrio lentus]|nr:molybdopterin-dependent oxidoreductase [Vibrio lentus]
MVRDSSGLSSMYGASCAHLTEPTYQNASAAGEDMQQAGKRHPFYNQYTVGFDDNGVIQGADITRCR